LIINTENFRIQNSKNAGILFYLKGAVSVRKDKYVSQLHRHIFPHLQMFNMINNFLPKKHLLGSREAIIRHTTELAVKQN
jgi:hypothetical protein